jgi:hypothetical protein
VTVLHRDHRLIFLKTRKTAGSALEIHLIKSTELGSDVYCTSRDALQHGLPTRRRSSVLPGWHEPIFVDLPAILARRLPRIAQHQPAERLQRVLGARIWERSIKVAGVRNPWEQLLSYWRWLSRGSGGVRPAITVPFDEWARAAIARDPESRAKARFDARRLAHDFLFIDGAPVIDHFLRFEDVDGSLAAVGAALGVHVPPLSVRAKASQPVDYRAYYSEELANEVGDFFADVLELTGYSF